MIDKKNLFHHLHISKIDVHGNWFCTQDEIVWKSEKKGEDHARESQQYRRAYGAVFDGPYGMNYGYVPLHG